MTLHTHQLLRLVFVFLACALLSACAGNKPFSIPGISETPQESGEDLKVLRMDSLPDHAQAVLADLLNSMRGKPGRVSRDVTPAPDVLVDHDLSFNSLKGFNAVNLHITNLTDREIQPGTYSVLFQGFVVFRNDIGQSIHEQFILDYTVREGKPILLNSSVAGPMEPLWPSVTGFYVDAPALQRAAPKLTSIEDYYRWAWNNAIDMFATNEESEAMGAYEALSLIDKAQTDRPGAPMMGDFAFLAFCMDRLPPDGLFEIKVNTSESGVGASDAEPYYLMDEQGFVMGVARFRAPLFDWNNRFYCHAFYTPGISSGREQDAMHVGLFPSVKTYGPFEELYAPPGGEDLLRQYAEAQTARPANARPASRPGMMDLSSIQDAKTVQQRLAELGYYSGAIDGLFGPNSLSSLRAFRRERMGLDGAEWDMDTQRALFPEAGADNLLDLSNQNDAAKVQAKLAKLGYYSGAIDGLFGANSKKALRAFRKAVMGSDAYAWDMETQRALFE